MITKNGISVRAWTALNGDRLVEISGPEIDRLSPVQRQAFVDHLAATVELSVGYAYGAGRVSTPRPAPTTSGLPAPRPGRSLTDEVPA